MIVARRTQNKAVSSLNISEQYYSSIVVVSKSERFTSEQQSRPPPRMFDHVDITKDFLAWSVCSSKCQC